jgi:hypothetical protein
MALTPINGRTGDADIMLTIPPAAASVQGQAEPDGV